jgi:hypothetical protein
MSIFIKRAYEEPSGNDGYKAPLGRVWPRGVTWETLQLDAWSGIWRLLLLCGKFSLTTLKKRSSSITVIQVN